MAGTERSIALVQEYRTRLIADVVTGKLDVREAAAGLPEEGEVSDTEPEVDMGEEEAIVEDSPEEKIDAA